MERACRAASFSFLDVRGIIVRHGVTLDQQLIWDELRPLLERKDEPRIEERLKALLASAGRGARR